MSVYFEPISMSDLPKLRNWRNSPSIFQWCRQTDLISAQDHLNWFNSLDGNSSIRMYLIKSSVDMAPIGVCGLTSIDLVNQRAEFSLYIGPESHGFGEDALRLLLKTGFDRYPLHRIYGEVFDGNPAMKLFERVGFVREGIRKDFYFKRGKFIDAHIISIGRSDVECW